MKLHETQKLSELNTFTSHIPLKGKKKKKGGAGGSFLEVAKQKESERNICRSQANCTQNVFEIWKISSDQQLELQP